MRLRQIPLTEHFFDAKSLYGKPEDVEQDYAGLVAHIRNFWGMSQPFGTSRWASLSVEDVFTSLTLLNDFSASGTDEKARSQLLVNGLIRYIRRSISYSTLFRFGVHTKFLAQRLKPKDSVLSFNYDLLMDQELLNDADGPLQYQNFSVKLLGADILDVGPSYCEARRRLSEAASVGPTDGLYLKLHGSLNWFTCANRVCPLSKKITVVPSVGQCLGSSAIGVPFQCNYCHSYLVPFIVPPLVEKRVMTEPHLRNIWGNAFALLQDASKIVVIGFSFQPSDFYATWLFRYALKGRSNAKVWVVNPLNDPAKAGHSEFRERMSNIFVNGYDETCFGFHQVGDVLNAGD
jgi:hypothetical protein